MYKSTIDWSKIMIMSKTLEKNQYVLFIYYKEFDGRKDISVRF